MAGAERSRDLQILFDVAFSYGQRCSARTGEHDRDESECTKCPKHQIDQVAAAARIGCHLHSPLLSSASISAGSVSVSVGVGGAVASPARARLADPVATPRSRECTRNGTGKPRRRVAGREGRTRGGIWALRREQNLDGENIRMAPGSSSLGLCITTPPSNYNTNVLPSAALTAFPASPAVHFGEEDERAGGDEAATADFPTRLCRRCIVSGCACIVCVGTPRRHLMSHLSGAHDLARRMATVRDSYTSLGDGGVRCVHPSHQVPLAQRHDAVEGVGSRRWAYPRVWLRTGSARRICELTWEVLSWRGWESPSTHRRRDSISPRNERPRSRVTRLLPSDNFPEWTYHWTASSQSPDPSPHFARSDCVGSDSGLSSANLRWSV